MSVIIRDSHNKVTIFTKGADNVMLEKITFQKPNLKEVVVSDLYKYSCEGYRTLVIASRILTESEFRGFDTIYK